MRIQHVFIGSHGPKSRPSESWIAAAKKLLARVLGPHAVAVRCIHIECHRIGRNGDAVAKLLGDVKGQHGPRLYLAPEGEGSAWIIHVQPPSQGLEANSRLRNEIQEYWGGTILDLKMLKHLESMEDPTLRRDLATILVRMFMAHASTKPDRYVLTKTLPKNLTSLEQFDAARRKCRLLVNSADPRFEVFGYLTEYEFAHYCRLVVSNPEHPFLEGIGHARAAVLLTDQRAINRILTKEHVGLSQADVIGRIRTSSIFILAKDTEQRALELLGDLPEGIELTERQYVMAVTAMRIVYQEAVHEWAERTRISEQLADNQRQQSEAEEHLKRLTTQELELQMQLRGMSSENPQSRALQALGMAMQTFATTG